LLDKKTLFSDLLNTLFNNDLFVFLININPIYTDALANFSKENKYFLSPFFKRLLKQQKYVALHEGNNG